MRDQLTLEQSDARGARQAEPVSSRKPPALCLRRAHDVELPRVRDLLLRHGHVTVQLSQVAIVATVDGEIIAVAVGSSSSCAAESDFAVEPGWTGSGVAAALGCALGEELCTSPR